ncbi:MAG: D-alanyl-D-alanine carboxypeptidase family protein [Rickettsiales bacterium]
MISKSVFMKLALRILIIATIFFLPVSVSTPFYENDAYAKRSSYKKKAKPKYHRKFSALVVNAKTGRILYEKNAGGTRYPASLTKMMTLYLTFDALKKKKITMSTKLKVSKKAAAQPQTNISLKKGDTITVRDAIKSLIVRSANDSSVVLAEKLGGTTWKFSLMMTKKARALGMKNTVYRNPNGLPNNQQITTAYDMAKLGIALKRDFPEYYHLFKLTSFNYAGVHYRGHNDVVKKYKGADGIKTGYINASGFNLVSSARRGNHKIIGVIMGGRTAKSRDQAMMKMLDKGFDKLQRQQAKRLSDKKSNKKKPSLRTANDNYPKKPVLSARAN